MRTVSLIIPVCSLDSSRLISFHAVLRQVISCNLLETIVVEQPSNGNELVGLPEGVTYLLCDDIPAGLSRKAALCNRAAAVATGEVLWVHDADMIFTVPMSSVADRIRESNAQAIHPFRHFVRLDKENTEKKLQGLPAAGSQYVDMFGAGSFAVSRDLFRSIRGFSEQFVGWGGEDVLVGQMIRDSVDWEVVTFENIRGVHLWHLAPDRAKGPVAGNNQRRLDKALKGWDKNRWNFIKSMKSCLPVPLPPRHLCKDIKSEMSPLSVLLDTALIMSYAYEDPRRHTATLKALRRTVQLRPMPCLYIGAMCDDVAAEELRSIVAPVGGVVQRITLHPEHAHVFHKEDVYNYLMRLLRGKYRCFLFLDADTWPEDTKWASRAAQAICAGGDGVFWQPWSSFFDTEDSSLSGLSMIARFAVEKNWDSHANPGLCVGMTGGTFDMMGGFPTNCPAGAGDTALMIEITHREYDCPNLRLFPYFGETLRASVPKLKTNFVQGRMVHEHHGNKQTRGYLIRHYLLQAYWPWTKEEMWVDEDGLICVNPDSSLSRCLAHRRNAADQEGLLKLFRDAGSDRHVYITLEGYIEVRTKNPTYCTGRWGYLKKAAEMLWRSAPKGEVLEIGPKDLPVVLNASYMTLWETPEEAARGAVIHDAGVAPWPYPDKAFAATLALQVVEHIEDKKTFFLEASRVSRDVVLISVPWNWKTAPANEADHLGINEETIAEWTKGTPVLEYSLDDSQPGKHRMVMRFSPTDLTAHLAETCIVPWCNLHVWSGSSTVCCFAKKPFLTYPKLDGGPYNKEDVWNGEEVQKQRTEFLNSPVSVTCKSDCTCTPRGKTIDEQLSFYRDRYRGDPAKWDAVRRAVSSRSTVAPPPLLMNVNFGNKCNARCPMCDSKASDNSKALLVTDVQLDNLRELCKSSVMVHVSGGDLFALKDREIDAVLSIAPEEASVETTTNAIGLTLDMWKKYVQNGPIRGLRISVDTVDPDMYALQRGVKRGPTVVKNLREIVNFAGDASCIRVIYSAVNGWTLKGLPDLFRFVVELGVPELGVTPTYGTALARNGFAEEDIFGKGWSPEVSVLANKVDEELRYIETTFGRKLTGWSTVLALLQKGP